MEHEQASELLSEYLDGTLSGEQAGALEAHLAECADCRRDLALLRQTLAAMDRMPRVKAPPQFARRVALRARRAGLLRRRRRLTDRLGGPSLSSWTLWGLLLAVGLLLVVVLIAQQQIELLTLPPAPVPIELSGPGELAAAVDCAAGLGAEVRAAGRPLPPGADLAGIAVLDLRLAPGRWPDWAACLRSAGPGAALPAEAPRPGPDGRLHLELRLPPADAGQPAGP